MASAEQDPDSDHLSSSCSSFADDEDQPELNLSQPQASGSKVMLLNGQLSVVEKVNGRLKKYVCTHPGCGKAYTRPVRLEEHLRSHSGQASFKSSEFSAWGTTFSRPSAIPRERTTTSHKLTSSSYITTETLPVRVLPLRIHPLVAPAGA